MRIKLWADLVDWPLEAFVDGDVITINGDIIDLSGIPDGFRLPGSAVGNKFFVEAEYVERINGVLNFTIRLPVHWDSPEEYRNPSDPIIIDLHSGPVKFPDTTPIVADVVLPTFEPQGESENGGLEQA
ncbi:hypothetical protein IM720_15450 [Pseudomonas fluorescens]|uniref:Uncharacterized protein n=1 Tax=Pseudomonas fluorescens TaxID=294 RepID=A0A7M2JEH2_PSEFL|nr:hypothetical protein [Pseudomonas fluorescens]QOU08055.1 hypothetical protein IM720_15450 [Pseudomonas fluorescens]